MPLSEHEQRVLEQMEQALYAEDPRFAHGLRAKTSAGLQRRHAAIGILAAIVGLGLVILAVSTQQIWIGGIGFVAMIGGAAYAFTPRETKSAAVLGTVDSSGKVTKANPAHPAGSKTATRKPKRGGAGGFMQRMEQRWDKRREQGPF